MIVFAALVILTTVAVIANSWVLDRRAGERSAQQAAFLVRAFADAGQLVVDAIEENSRLRPVLNPPNRGVDFEEKLAKLKKAAAPPQLAEGELPRPIIVQAD